MIHEPCGSRGDCYHSHAGKIGGKIGGLISGRKNSESGQLDRIRELPQTKVAQRENGRNQGRKNVESGHLARITKLPQTKAAQREIGRKNVESGHLAKARKKIISDPEWHKKGGQAAFLKFGNPATSKGVVKGGRAGGRKMVESGVLTQNSYGIPCVTSTGILVKSVTEVIFFEVALALGAKPEYEPIVIDNYTPDFVLGKSVLGLPANTPIELKPTRNWRKIRPRRKQRIPRSVLVLYANKLWRS